VKRYVKIAVLLFSLMVAAACAHNSNTEVAQVAASGNTCRVDKDCREGFCDRGVCQTPEGVYGRQCKAAPRIAEGPRDGKLNTCGAYLCLDSRCRSCTSDSQCQSELGSPRCYKAEEDPGYRCGNPAR
jgi:hypothetical protein